MSYSPEDSAWDDAYDNLSKELYPEHKEQAIAEFTADRLRSYYAKNPQVTASGVLMYKEGKSLFDQGHFSAALVFSASATELFLKAALLKPVVYGLVHSDSLAEIVVESALSQPGYSRYEKLLSQLFSELAHIDLKELKRNGVGKALLAEATDMQTLRNSVVHRGQEITRSQAETSISVTANIFTHVLCKMLEALGLRVGEGGNIVKRG